MKNLKTFNNIIREQEKCIILHCGIIKIYIMLKILERILVTELNFRNLILNTLLQSRHKT